MYVKPYYSIKNNNNIYFVLPTQVKYIADYSVPMMYIKYYKTYNCVVVFFFCELHTIGKRTIKIAFLFFPMMTFKKIESK